MGTLMSAGREGRSSVVTWAVALLTLFCWTCVVASHVLAQQEEPPAAEEEAAPADTPPPGEEAPEPAAGEPATGEGLGIGKTVDEEDFNAIDDLLREDEAVRAGPEGGASYDPGTRRDPFRSLIVQREQPKEAETERPDGIPGLLIDELEVQGVFVLPEGPVAQIMSASHDTSFLLRPGDELWDGDVVSISLEEVVFKQVVTDTTALKPFQLVVKRLNP